MSIDLEHNKLYFFDYDNQHKKFDVIIYSDQSDLDVSLIKYDPMFGQSFLDVIENELNVVKNFTFKKGSPPW